VRHGGVVTTLLDTACYLALLPQLADDEHAVTHDLTVSLIRPVPADARVDVIGSVLRRGRAAAFLRAEEGGGRRGRGRRTGHPERRRTPLILRPLIRPLITRATSTG
jgi:acyl-coenzyme A thioesterase PaaI-like protein